MATILRLSESSALGLHAMAYLARHPGDRVSSRQLASILGASEHTVAKTMHALVRGRFVDAIRGSRGGFRLACDPAAVTLLTIYECIDGPFEDTGCLLREPACDGAPCVMRELMHRLNAQVREHFGTTTLADLAGGIRFAAALADQGEDATMPDQT